MQQELERLASSEKFLLFSCDGIIAPHHSRFTRSDREKLDRALEDRFGKHRDNGACIVVATQTVQQSLDLDADLLITDLCPLDVLLQRIGRLHRHARKNRPLIFKQAKAIVLVPRVRDLGVLLSDTGRARHHHGLGTVYPDLRVIEASWRLIELHPVWQIPQMNRLLVEKSVHSECLSKLASKLGRRWTLHEQEILGSLRGQSRTAELCLVDWTKPYSESSFAGVIDRRISTRLGEGDRRIVFDPSFRSVFGNVISELVLRADWVRDVSHDISTATEVESRHGSTRFRFGDRRFLYDRLGLRPDMEKDNEDETGP